MMQGATEQARSSELSLVDLDFNLAPNTQIPRYNRLGILKRAFFVGCAKDDGLVLRHSPSRPAD